MSKKEKIVELLQKNKDIDEICTELDVTKSYVYRIQREIDESKGDNDDSVNGKDGNPDDLVKHPAGGSGFNVEKNDGNLEEKENKRDTVHTGAVGGVKKKKRKKNKKVNSEPEINEQTRSSLNKNTTLGGIKLWMMLKWKKLLLILTLLILLITAILSSFMKMGERPKRPEMGLPRYPVLR